MQSVVRPLHPSRSETFPYRERVFVYGGVPVQYFDSGDPPAQGAQATRDTVAVVHGLGANLTHFEYVAPALVEAGFRVVGLDLPGFGLSGKPHRRVSIAWLSGAVLALLDHVGVREAALLGHSLGGLVVADAALRAPERVPGLVLVSSAGLFSMPLPLRLAARTIPWRGPVQAIAGAALERGARRLLGRVFWETNHRTERFIEQSTAARPGAERFMSDLMRVMGQARHDLVSYTLFDEAARLTMPTLVIWGERDRLLPSSRVAGWTERLPAGELEVLSSCGHMSIIENPEAVIRRVAPFLRSAFRPPSGS